MKHSWLPILTLVWLLALPLLLISLMPGQVMAGASDRAPSDPSETAYQDYDLGDGEQFDAKELHQALLARLAFEDLDLQLVGSATFEGRQSCFIRRPGAANPTALEVGSTIDGYTLAAIETDAVLFVREGQQFWVSAEEAEDGEMRMADEAWAPHPIETEPVEVAEIAEDLVEESVEKPATAGTDAPEEDAQDYSDANYEVKVAQAKLKTRTRTYEVARLVEDGAEAGPRLNKNSKYIRDHDFILPMHGRLTSRYGYRRHPMGGGRRHHNGIDIAAPHGTPIRAAADGTVRSVRYTSALGRHIIVRHANGYETVYGHLSKALVKSGQRVAQGQTIGNEGSTGRSTGPHLHFEIRKNGRTVNPEYYVRVR